MDTYADIQTGALRPEIISGYHTDNLPERSERFLKIHSSVMLGLIARGRNYVTVSVHRTYFYPYTIKAELDRVELAVKYIHNEG